jgi:DNA-binding MarR family transcriptional regulator
VSIPLADRAATIRALIDGLRAVTGQSVLFSEAVAARVGLNPTDLECLDLLARHGGSLSAKRLAELAGLTTGGTTFVIDRLERAGFARRAPNPRDRRGILVEVVPEAVARRLDPLYTAMGAAVAALCERYSDEELRLVLDFITRAAEIGHAETARLGVRPAPGDDRAETP